MKQALNESTIIRTGFICSDQFKYPEVSIMSRCLQKKLLIMLTKAIYSSQVPICMQFTNYAFNENVFTYNKAMLSLVGLTYRDFKEICSHHYLFEYHINLESFILRIVWSLH